MKRQNLLGAILGSGTNVRTRPLRISALVASFLSVAIPSKVYINRKACLGLLFSGRTQIEMNLRMGLIHERDSMFDLRKLHKSAMIVPFGILVAIWLDRLNQLTSGRGNSNINVRIIAYVGRFAQTFVDLPGWTSAPKLSGLSLCLRVAYWCKAKNAGLAETNLVRRYAKRKAL
jgi:hypothetical protein